MTHINQPPHIEVGQIIPAFTLPGADGMPHSPWDYKHRQNLILLFLNSASSSETRSLLGTFSKAYSTIREEQCSILAISQDMVLDNLLTQGELHLPYPLLADPQGEVFSQYTRRNATMDYYYPCLVLADRYNTLYQQWIAEREADLPRIDELLDSLQYLNKLCTP
ncbi:MAG: redoxin domain-containing protein [Ktedonobacteraceae bacterium]